MPTRSYETCKTCGRLAWFDERGVTYHSCQPLWQWKPSDNQGDWDDYEEVRASDAEGAAEKAAEIYDSSDGDYPIIRGNNLQISVRPVSSPDIEYHFNIWGESVPSYHASAVEGDSP